MSPLSLHHGFQITEMLYSFSSCAPSIRFHIDPAVLLHQLLDEEHDLSKAHLETLASLPAPVPERKCQLSADCPGQVCVDGSCDFCRTRTACGVSRVCDWVGGIDRHVLLLPSEITLLREANESSGFKSTCRFKRLREPFSGRDSAGTVLMFLSSALANAGGLGGGTLFVPVLMLVMTFSAMQASALSQALVTGGSIAATIFHSTRRHPERARPAIDFDLLIVATPSLLAGTLFGVFFARLFPNFVSGALLCCLLTYAFRSSAFLGLRLYREDRCIDLGKRPVSSKEARISTAPHLEEERPASPVEKEGKSLSRMFPRRVVADFDAFVRPHCSSLSDLIADEGRSAPKGHILFLLVTWLVTSIGSSLRRIGNRPCSSSDIAFLVGTFFALSALASIAALRVTRLATLQTRLGYVRHEKDVVWSPAMAANLIGFFVFAGIISAWVGIGPAALMTPYLLTYARMDPRIVQAVSAVANALMSSSVAMQLALSGVLLRDYAIYLGCISCLGAMTGLYITSRVISRDPSLRSLIVFALSAVFLVSLLLEISITFRLYSDAVRRGTAFALRSACETR